MKLQAINTIIRRKGKTEIVHSPNDAEKGKFECPDDEGQGYVDMGAAREVEDDSKPAKKPAAKKAAGKKAAAKPDPDKVVDPAKVAGTTGKTGDEDMLD